MTPPVVAIPTHDDVQVLTPSQADWTDFVQRELDALGIDMSELRRQARERDFQSTAARELWVMAGDSKDQPHDGHQNLRG